MGPPLVGVTPIFAISFWGYDLGKRLVYSATPNRTDAKLSVAELAIAGGFSAIPATLVAGPAERVKVLLQVQGQGSGGVVYKGPFDVVRSLYKQGGLKSIFRGTGATLGRDGPGSAAYFVAYELVKDALKPTNSDQLSVPAIITAGAAAGVAMWSIALPADTVKSKLQSASEGTYKGVVDCVRKTWGESGWRGFYHGFGPAMARAVPANGKEKWPRAGEIPNWMHKPLPETSTD
ncbi:hypothetical protein QFC21_002176 [Naganishia friedmannii]|uniref:Uncharacterized protein n=1 Tax=Naganishia friedmannii TaxID=89922 RepID=A0ACC2VZ56_9TREE|nr:hypothetical protein QFC21_002176 [Naganishia friedmannii]